MFVKNLKLIFIIFLFYQTPLFSKSNSFNDFKSKNLSNYFSGIIAFENKNTDEALDFFKSSKILLNRHDPFLQRLIFSLVLENKISEAINIIKINKNKKNSDFFDAYFLLIIDSLKKNDFDNAQYYLNKASKFSEGDRFVLAILETLDGYIYVFKNKKLQLKEKNFGNLSLISQAFQRCYLSDQKTETLFTNLINAHEGDYTRYTYFYLSYLIENNRIDEAKELTENINYINTTLLLSQAKSWIENENFKKFNQVFSCKNHSDILSEFLFLLSNLYSSQDNYKKSNFYLNISNHLNPKFIFNLSLISENFYNNGEYEKTKKILKNFKPENDFYYWYRIKKFAQIISKEKGKEEGIRFIDKEFNKITKTNSKFIFDIANFYRASENYKGAIKYYTQVLESLTDDKDIKFDVLYRRGGSFERIKNYEKADQDLLQALEIDPDDAYVLNYLAYSWLERNYRIGEAIEMLENAYKLESDDPYIIDSIGWAYFLTDDFLKAEKFLKRAVELMPYDPIVNDHYGDILWKLDRKIQARYFWSNVLEMKNVDKSLIQKINEKLIEGLKNS